MAERDYRSVALIGGATGLALGALALQSNVSHAEYWVVGLTLSGLLLAPLALGANAEQMRNALFRPARGVA